MNILRKQLSRANFNSIRKISSSYIRFGGDHHGPMMPPFARLRPPTGTVISIINL